MSVTRDLPLDVMSTTGKSSRRSLSVEDIRLAGLLRGSLTEGIVSADASVIKIMAPFIRWEASVQDDLGDLLQQSIVAGLALRWGAETPTLQNYDRRYFKPSCGGVVLIGRIC